MDACLKAEEWDEVERYAKVLKEYTSAEPVPWCDFFIARGRALARFGRGLRDDNLMRQLRDLRNEASRVGLRPAIPALDQALGSFKVEK